MNKCVRINNSLQFFSLGGKVSPPPLNSRLALWPALTNNMARVTVRGFHSLGLRHASICFCILGPALRTLCVKAVQDERPHGKREAQLPQDDTAPSWAAQLKAAAWVSSGEAGRTAQPTHWSVRSTGVVSHAVTGNWDVKTLSPPAALSLATTCFTLQWLKPTWELPQRKSNFEAL